MYKNRASGPIVDRRGSRLPRVDSNVGLTTSSAGKTELAFTSALRRARPLVPFCSRAGLVPLKVRGRLLPLFLFVSLSLVWCLESTAVASAFARIEGAPSFSSASTLPEGRVYELVSPADKNGNEAGANTSPAESGAKNDYGYASPEGDAVLYEGTGPMGESPWGNSLWFVSTKNVGASGWSTRALMPRELTNENLLASKGSTLYIDPSQDLSHSMLEAGLLGSVANAGCNGPIFVTGSDPFVEGTWVERPSPELENSIESCGGEGLAGAPIGGTPDFSTVYFTVPGTLLPEDSSRAAHAGEAWGLYEYTEGALHEAGVLPDGSLSPFGAVPAASGHGRNVAGNQVSEDGSRVFFVSPDPGSCEPNGRDDCATDPPELYVRENGQRTELVSGDTLLTDPAGNPVAAPGGISRMANPSDQVGGSLDRTSGSFVFASPDGSHAFFQSTEALTQAAAEDSPGGEAKTYDFDVDTGSLTFLPGVQGEILATDSSGSDMAFISPEAAGQPARLDLWSAAGTGGGIVTPVVALPGADPGVPETRLSADGAVLVFQTAALLSSSFNSGGYEQIYRYDVSANTLGCVSCDPAGLTPRGNAEMSILLTDEQRGNQIGSARYEPPIATSLDQRGISSDGERIFFDSPDPLVPQDSNTDSPDVRTGEEEEEAQGRDVYEWAEGVVHLVSTGQSSRDSYLLDSSENGDDVFFATVQSLVSSDTDGGYDVYDARIPRPGDTPSPSPGPCGGSSCQGAAVNGPPVVSSSGFSGAGNLVPGVTTPPTKKVVPLAKCPKGKARKKGSRTCTKVKAKPKPKKTNHKNRGR